MVWSFFWDRNQGTFVPLIVKSVNKHVYLQLSEYPPPSVMIRMYKTFGNAIFMQDNAPIHKSIIVQEWLEWTEYEVDDHLPYSSDLNPIKHV